MYAIRKRKTGQTLAACRDIARSLRKGQSVFVTTIGENEEYLSRCQRIIKNECSLDVVYEAVTTTEPNSNFRFIWGRYDEIVGIEYVEQVTKIIGYTVKIK